MKKQNDQNELRYLKRIELVDIIYRLQNHEDELNNEIASLKKQLADRELKLSKAGNIAEAAIAINDVFAAAQKAADEYVSNVQLQTDKQSQEILSNAQKEADAIKQEAEEEVKKTWMKFKKNILVLYKKYPELKEYMVRESRKNEKL